MLKEKTGENWHMSINNNIIGPFYDALLKNWRHPCLNLLIVVENLRESNQYVTSF
jgi:hypothetical protein